MESQINITKKLYIAAIAARGRSIKTGLFYGKTGIRYTYGSIALDMS